MDLDMPATVKVQCPVCQTLLDLPYRLVGAPMVCATCGHTEVPVVPVGTILPDTGHELTFRDFLQLLRESHGQRALRRRLGELLGHTVVGEGEGLTIRSNTGQVIDPLTVHEQVQDDPVRQRALHGEAQAQWR